MPFNKPPLVMDKFPFTYEKISINDNCIEKRIIYFFQRHIILISGPNRSQLIRILGTGFLH